MAKSSNPRTKVTVKTSARMSKKGPLSPESLRKLDAWWRASNYLAAGQLYLRDNPLLRTPLKPEHLKHTPVGHWGTVPGQNFIYTHLNRVITKYDLNMIYVCGPGHGGAAVLAQTYLEGTYSEIYPNVSQDEEGMRKLFQQFSFPGGVGSHCAPDTPGSINEGGELGYSLAHAFGAVMDNPDLIAACVVGDGEAETAPLAAAWHGNKFLDPVGDGAVLPILHLNGYKNATPSLLARISPEEVEDFFKGCGWTPRFVEGDDPAQMHQKMAAALDWAVREIQRIQESARSFGETERPRWPMVVFRSPKGWTCPKEVDGVPLEGTSRVHQLPLAVDDAHPEVLPLLEEWLRSYHPEELFDEAGAPVSALRAMAPQGARRMGSNPHANGGLLLRDLRTPDFSKYAVAVPAPGEAEAEDMAELGKYVKDVLKLNQKAKNFRGGQRPPVERRPAAIRRGPVPQRAYSGRDAVRAYVPGLAGGLPAHRPPRLPQQLRGFHPHCGLHGEPVRKMAQGGLSPALAAGHRLSQLCAVLQRVAAGSERLHPPGPGLSGSCGQQEGRRGAALPAPRRQLPAVLLRPLHQKPQLHQRVGDLQAPPAPVAHHGRGHQALHPRHRHLAVGLQRPGT